MTVPTRPGRIFGLKTVRDPDHIQGCPRPPEFRFGGVGYTYKFIMNFNFNRAKGASKNWNIFRANKHKIFACRDAVHKRFKRIICAHAFIFFVKAHALTIADFLARFKYFNVDWHKPNEKLGYSSVLGF